MQKLFVKIIFSSAVFGEKKPRYCYTLGVVVVRHRCRAKTVTFRNISVANEDIYLKLEVHVCVNYPKNNLYYYGRQFKMHFFFFRIMSLFRLKLFILHQAPHNRALAPACGALVLISHSVFYPFGELPIIFIVFKTVVCKHFKFERGPSRGSVVKCLTHNPGVLGSSLTGSSGFFSWECPLARHFRA